jgi:beta-lactamase regulating signal transducer with metallopeptidase domain
MNTVLVWLGQNTIVVALMVPAVLLLCRLFRARPAVQHMLWLVLLVKLVMPPFVESSWLAECYSAWTQPTEESPIVDVRAANDRPSLEEITPLPDFEVLAAAPELAVPIIEAIEVDDTTLSRDEVTQAVFVWWCVGCGGACLIQLRRIGRHRSLIRAGRVAPRHLDEEIGRVSEEMGVRKIRAVVAPRIASPFVWCFGWLRLIWPAALLAESDVRRSRGIIAHELAHVRRRDHWVAWLDLAAGLLLWWNPVFWFVRRRLRESAELACDALALGALPEERRAYAEMFLELSSGFKSGTPAPVLGMSTGAPSSFERRLTMILSDRVSGKMSFVGLLLVGALAALAVPSWTLGQAGGGAAAQPLTDFERRLLNELRQRELAIRISEIEQNLKSLTPEQLKAKQAELAINIIQFLENDRRKTMERLEKMRDTEKALQNSSQEQLADPVVKRQISGHSYTIKELEASLKSIDVLLRDKRKDLNDRFGSEAQVSRILSDMHAAQAKHQSDLAAAVAQLHKLATDQGPADQESQIASSVLARLRAKRDQADPFEALAGLEDKRLKAILKHENLRIQIQVMERAIADGKGPDFDFINGLAKSNSPAADSKEDSPLTRLLNSWRGLENEWKTEIASIEEKLRAAREKLNQDFPGELKKLNAKQQANREKLSREAKSDDARAKALYETELKTAKDALEKLLAKEASEKNTEAKLESAKARLQKLLKETPKLPKEGSATAKAANQLATSYEPLRKLRADEQELLQRYGAKHPDVLTVRRAIEAMEKALQENLSDELIKLRAQEQKLLQDIGAEHPEVKAVRRAIEYERAFRAQTSAFQFQSQAAALEAERRDLLEALKKLSQDVGGNKPAAREMQAQIALIEEKLGALARSAQEASGTKAKKEPSVKSDPNKAPKSSRDAAAAELEKLNATIAQLKAMLAAVESEKAAALRAQQAEKEDLLRRQQQLLDRINALQSRENERQPAQANSFTTKPSPSVTGKTTGTGATTTGVPATSTAKTRPTPAATDFSVMKLTHVKAKDMAKVLLELLGRDGNSNLVIVAEPTTNSLLVRATREQQQIIEALVARLEDYAASGKGPAPGPRSETPPKGPGMN